MISARLGMMTPALISVLGAVEAALDKRQLVLGLWKRPEALQMPVQGSEV